MPDPKTIGKKQHYCAPSIKSNRSKQSCLSRDMLLLITKMYNQTHKEKIAYDKSFTHKMLWNNINNMMKPTCGNNEACWIDQKFIKNAPIATKLEKSFRPKKPESWNTNAHEWLNTYDILNVMKQYEDSNKSFKFIGVFPIDFASKTSSGSCVVQEMCKLDLKSLWKQKVKKVGIVFNTDDSKGEGEHWISVYIGLNPKSKNFGVFFYDSVAMSPPHEVVKFMKNVFQELKDLHTKHGDKVQQKVNKIRKQWKNFSCGLYSMLFIISMLKSSFDDVCVVMGNDDDVEKFRDILYRPNNTK